MFSLWCANKLGVCPPSAKKRFRFTCLYCRIRRKFYGKYKEPKHYVGYVYKNVYTSKQSFDGSLKKSYVVLIDPRRKFLHFRLNAIKVLDHLIKITKHKKPFVEICELLANYP